MRDVCVGYADERGRLLIAKLHVKNKASSTQGVVRDRSGLCMALPWLRQRAMQREGQDCREREREQQATGVTERTKELAEQSP